MLEGRLVVLYLCRRPALAIVCTAYIALQKAHQGPSKYQLLSYAHTEQLLFFNVSVFESRP